MGKKKEKQKQPAVQKYNLSEVEDIWNTLLSDDESDFDEELFEGENLLYGDTDPGPGSGNEPVDFIDDQLADQDFDNSEIHPGDVLDVSQVLDIHGGETEDDELSDEIIEDESSRNVQAQEMPVRDSPVAEEFAAMLMFADGMQQEVARARLFAPEKETVLLVDEDTGDELIISFDQLACIRISGLPAGITASQKKFASREIIETVDGGKHHVLVASKPDVGCLLACFPADARADFPAVLFPKSNISRRVQVKQLTDILLEKRFVSHTILQRVLQEFEQLKSMTIEKIIAQRTRVPLAKIEETLADAARNQMLGMQPAEILLISGLVKEEQILDALEYHEYLNNLEIEQFLIEKGVVKEPEVYLSLAEKHQIPFVDLRRRKIPRDCLTLLPKAMIARYEILPLVKKDDVLLVAAHHVDISDLREPIAKAAGCKKIKHVLSPPSQIRQIIKLVQAHRA